MRIFRKKCLDNSQAGLMRKAESMSEAWAILDGIFGDPMADAKRLIEGFKTLPSIRSKKDQRFAAGFALLNLPKGKSLGRSKPETNSSNEQAH